MQILNTNFQQYYDTVFSSYVTAQLQTAQQVDVTADKYIKNSLNSIINRQKEK